MRAGFVLPEAETIIRLFVDEQSTKTNGYYGLRESIEAEFTRGVDNYKQTSAHGAIFRGSVRVRVKLCDSKKYALIRASDLLANAIYHQYNGEAELSVPNRHLTMMLLPSLKTVPSERDALPSPALQSRN